MIIEKYHTIAGIAGTLKQLERSGGLMDRQVWTARRTKGRESFVVEIRFDDNCKNGHMYFAVTGILYVNGRDECGGSCHELVVKWFPELAPLIRWHLVSTDGPMFYFANTTYHVDQHGPTHAWVYYQGAIVSDPLRIGDDGVKERLLGYVKASVAQRAVGVEGYRVQWDEKTSKTRNLGYARHSAVWPEATEEQLCASKEALTAALTARLPALIAEFRAAMVDFCGFEWGVK